MKIHYLFLLLVSSVLLWIGCEKEVQSNNDDKAFPLTLNYTNDGGSDRFSWQEMNVRGFERYMLVRRGEPIPAGLTPQASQAIFQSTKSNDTVAVSSTALFFDSIGYYKLYAQIEGRWLESEQILVKSNTLVLSGIPLAATFFADSNWVVIMKLDNSSSLTGKVLLVDVDKKKSYTSNIPFPITTTDQIAMSTGYSDAKIPELYISTSSTFRKMALPSLTQTSQFASYSSPFSIVTGGSNLLLITNGLPSTSLNVRRKSDFSILKSHNRSNYFDHRTLGVLDTNTNLVVEASAFLTQVFNISPTGLISNTKTINEQGNQVFLNDLPISPNGQFLCPNASGTIYDQNLNVVGNVNSGGNLNSFMTMASFGKEDNFLYAFAIDFFSNTSSINKFDIANGAVVEQLVIPSGINVQAMGRTKKGLIAIMTNQSGGNNKYTVQVIDF